MGTPFSEYQGTQCFYLLQPFLLPYPIHSALAMKLLDELQLFFGRTITSYSQSAFYCYYYSSRRKKKFRKASNRLKRNFGVFCRLDKKIILLFVDAVRKIGTRKSRQGCQMCIFFKPKIRKLGKFWRVLQWKVLVHYMAFWSILQLFGIFCDHLVNFLVIWYIFSRIGMFYQEKSGNPESLTTGKKPCIHNMYTISSVSLLATDRAHTATTSRY
jgi:hypothetical protein